MGAVTVANVVQGVTGAFRTVECDVTFSTSYATGGDTLTPATFGLRQIDDVHVLAFLTKGPTGGGKLSSAVGIQPVLAGTIAAPLLQAYYNGAQVTAATNLSTLGAVRLEIRGH
jgi:hypothetical protein